MVLNKQNVIYTLLCVLVSLRVFAIVPYSPRTSDPLMEPWRWQAYPQFSGQGFLELQEDHDGNLYFLIETGIYRYDGKVWDFYPLDSLRVGEYLDFFILSDRVIAFGSRGFSQYKEGRWEFVMEWGLPFSITAGENNRFDVDHRDRIWIEVASSLICVDVKTGKKKYLYSPDIVGVREKIQGFEMIEIPGTAIPGREIGSSTGVIAVEGIVGNVIPGSPGDRAGVRIGDKILSSEEVQEPDGTSLVQMAMERSGGEHYTVDLEQKYLSGTIRTFAITCIFADSKNRLWCVDQGGQIILTLNLGHPDYSAPAAWQNYTTADGIEMSHSTYLAELPDGTIYMSTGDVYMGVNVFDGNRWSLVYPSDSVGGDNTFESILVTEDGVLWLGSFSRIVMLKAGKWHAYTSPDVPLPAARIELFSTSDGSVWICGLRGDVLRLDYRTPRWQSLLDLNFQCETSDGTKWYLTVEGRVVTEKHGRWQQYEVEDGLINIPTSIQATRDDKIWVTGSHDTAAAFCCFDGTTWFRKVLPDYSWGIDYRAFYEASDGRIYLGSCSNSLSELHSAGILIHDPRLGHPADPKSWDFSFSTRDPLEGYQHTIYGFAETSDNAIWYGSYEGVGIYQNGTLREYRPDFFGRVNNRRVDIFATTPDYHIWLACRGSGAYYYDTRDWTIFNEENSGLANNTISDILVASDRTVWVVTYKGVSRFDGTEWMTQTVPRAFAFSRESGSMRESGDGTLWFNINARDWYRRALNRQIATSEQYPSFKTYGYRLEKNPPETEITVEFEEIPQPGNAYIRWDAYDQWETTAARNLLYSYQLNTGEWSRFTSEKDHLFMRLRPGKYTFRVKARDRDMNDDPTPATLHFKVLFPVFLQWWFLLIVGTFLGIVALLYGRIRQRNRRIQESNKALESQAADLESAYNSMNKAVAELEESINHVANMAEGVAEGSNQIAISSQSLAEGAHEQASTLSQISAGLQEMTYTISQTLENTKNARILSERATQSSMDGMDHMQVLSLAMERIKTSAVNTREIIKTINTIADQTNLLALNAAIKAARAGDKGRGFAVVAEEVGKLAALSTKSVQNTEKLLKESELNADEGVQYNKKMLESLDAYIKIIKQVQDTSKEINDATEQENLGIQQITNSMEETNKVVHNNSTMAEEYAAAAMQITKHAEALQQEVNLFREALQELVRGNKSIDVSAPVEDTTSEKIVEAVREKLK